VSQLVSQEQAVATELKVAEPEPPSPQSSLF